MLSPRSNNLVESVKIRYRKLEVWNPEQKTETLFYWILTENGYGQEKEISEAR